MYLRYSTTIVLLTFISISEIITAVEPLDIERFVHRYLVIHNSKMESSPVVWQELKEGHLRTKAIFYGDNVLDSLQIGVPPLDIAVRHFQYLTNLRTKAYNSGDYNLFIDPPPKHTANYNYFSTSLD
ncbi:MAG: hypothetical protein CMG74_10970 [Candidatus Marinimicrobia bacterium]|nr:hypothetical protein [Candidatus Neomarinimicrobiota bacterium]|tara:strand:+ start:186 stop:566 length:381 start_codon:yes stop_codon:yes gene_type:complete